MLVSIIVSNFNYARYLRASIDSALQQTYPHLEVIVVDDGSTDASKQIILSYGDKIKSVFKANAGQTSAFNAGFSVSQGNLLLFLDSDDVLYPAAIESVVNLWRPQMSKVHFVLATTDENGSPLPQNCPPWPLDSGNVLPMLLNTGEYSTPPTSGNVFCRSFLLQVMPLPVADWPDNTDCYLGCAAPFYGVVGKLDAVLGAYRQHFTSMSAVVSNGRLSVVGLDKMLVAGINKQNLINAFAKQHGFKANTSALIDSPGYHKIKFLAAKYRSSDNPSPQVSLFRTLLNFLLAILRTNQLALRTKFAYFSWALLMTLLPRGLGEPVAAWAFPNYKSSLRKQLVHYRAVPKEELSAG